MKHLNYIGIGLSMMLFIPAALFTICFALALLGIPVALLLGTSTESPVDTFVVGLIALPVYAAVAYVIGRLIADR